jgi:hypothetical protein
MDNPLNQFLAGISQFGIHQQHSSGKKSGFHSGIVNDHCRGEQSGAQQAAFSISE